MNLPRLQSEGRSAPATGDCVVLAVYAPFGTDAALSTFPEGSSHELIQHPLVQNLLQVAASGIHVVALIDREADDTHLLQVPAGSASDIRVVSRWKQDMASPNTLSGFLQHAARLHPGASLVLALEGHGAGFLPDIDRRQLTPQKVTEDGRFEWHIDDAQSLPVLPAGFPLLPAGFPLLPAGFPLLPANHMPMSTFGIGAALKSALAAGVPKLALIHFNNCFNMSVELLHTVAPHADHAVGYINYNFFSAGAAYPSAFERLKAQGSARAHELATWLALANRDFLAAKGHHPTVGGAVALGRMAGIGERLDDLADALLAALRTPDPAQRAAMIGKIRAAIIRAQQLDAGGDMELEAPDEMTDLRSLAHELQAEDFGAFSVAAAAAALEQALAGVKQYGTSDQPWTSPAGFWDFSSEQLAMNIFLPDPLRVGLWDWRSPYYMNVNPTPAQPNVIDLLQATDWVDFLIEYHKDVPFKGLLAPAIPEYPLFNRHSDRLTYPDPQPCRPGRPPKGAKRK